MGDVGVACKGIVEPPQHRHGGAAQGTDSPGHDHRVDDDEVGTEGHAPGIGDIAAGRPGDDRGPGIQEEMQEPPHWAQHKYSYPMLRSTGTALTSTMGAPVMSSRWLMIKTRFPFTDQTSSAQMSRS